MTTTPYHMTVRTHGPLQEVEVRVRQALSEQGFGVLTEIDVQRTLKEKLDVDRGPMRILGACNPALAHKALKSEPTVAAFLPCNVTLFEDEGATVVSAMKPTVAMTLVGNPTVGDVAREAEERLWKALQAAVPKPLEEPVGAPA